MLKETSNNSEATMSFMGKDQKKKKKDYREHLVLLEDSSEVIYGNFYNK